MQSWVYCALTASEAAICVKFGRHMFPNLPIYPIIAWIAFLVRVVGTFFCVWLSVWWAHSISNTKEVDFDGEKRVCYIDSSHENLGAIHDDVCRRRRDLGFSESDLH
ncbi:unnamed protein product [Angiostrongylus costaricensis]|uniref:Integral membrane protein n=1 Tax=Angiostrongylus costaricensis TaxID=334426 RepID=A0A0R3PR49_ANGCS|nr:unnamed protein product [Angiostrongylus costaricensis]